jgi:hypothetical protein
MTRIESGVTIPKLLLFTLYLNVKKVTAKIFGRHVQCDVITFDSCHFDNQFKLFEAQIFQKSDMNKQN